MPFTLAHGIISFFLAKPFVKGKEFLALAFIAGMTPDLDGLPILFNTSLFYQVHHEITHPLVTGLIMGVIAALIARQFFKMDAVKSFAIFMAGFLSHLLADLFFTNWPIKLFKPFSEAEFSSPLPIEYGIAFSAIVMLLGACWLFTAVRKEKGLRKFIQRMLSRES